MNNPNNKKLTKSINPFLEDFSTSYEDISDLLSNTPNKINSARKVGEKRKFSKNENLNLKVKI